MTFNNTNGNITMGNLVMTNQAYGPQLLTAAGGPNYANVTTSAPDPARIVIGTGYNGNLQQTANYAVVSTGTTGASGLATRVLISDNFAQAPNVRTQGLCVQDYVQLTSNIAGSATNTRYQGLFAGAVIGGGSAGNTWSVSSGQNNGPVGSSTVLQIGGGTSGNLTGMGNTTVGFTNGMLQQTIASLGSNIGNAIGVLSYINQNQSGSTYGNVNNGAAFTASFQGTGQANANVIQSTTAIGYYHPTYTGGTGLMPGPTNGNIARMATNYYAFCNDDDLAQTKLGSLIQYHEYAYGNNATSGSITINKVNGQKQYISLSGALTISGFSNFVTAVTRPNASIAYQTDTVTLILDQGATGGYTVTLPTGAAYKYAGGSSTITVLANTVTTITVQAYYSLPNSATNYLITVNPAFA